MRLLTTAGAVYLYDLLYSKKLNQVMQRPQLYNSMVVCLGGAAVRRRTRDRKVAGSTPGWGTIKSTRSTQPSILPGSVNQVPACMAGVKAGRIHLCRVTGNTV